MAEAKRVACVRVRLFFLFSLSLLCVLRGVWRGRSLRGLGRFSPDLLGPIQGVPFLKFWPRLRARSHLASNGLCWRTVDFSPKTAFFGLLLSGFLFLFLSISHSLTRAYVPACPGPGSSGLRMRFLNLSLKRAVYLSEKGVSLSSAF
jgi:hypothetical protein